jgi:glycosyltransferase involved in cell wall biosynthesis
VFALGTGATVSMSKEAKRDRASAPVLLIGNYLADQQESMLRFERLLASLLNSHGVAHNTWRPPSLLGRIWRQGGAAKLAAYCDKFMLGGLQLLYLRFRGRYHLFHILDHGNSLYAFLLPASKTVITCHDCIAIEEAMCGRTGERVGRFGLFFQRLIAAGLRRVATVVAVSTETTRELQRLVSVSAKKIHIVPNSLYSSVSRIDASICRERLLKLGIAPERPFIFMLGSNLIRKNRARAIQAYELLRSSHLVDIQLVIAGQPLVGSSAHFLNNSKYHLDIHFLGKIDDDLLSILYSSCEIFFFPSLAEGFGVPIIEAQTCGAMVVTSNIAPMPEVGGDAAIYADPYRVEALAEALLQAVMTKNKFKELIVLNANRYTPEKMLLGYEAVYRELLI